MTDDPKKSHDDPDPLSATAMFLRALDQQSPKQPEPAPKSEPAVPGTSEKRAPAPLSGHGAGSAGEFTKVFGTPGRSQSPPEPAIPARPLASVPPEPARPAAGSPSAQGPGEFTRIFVKDEIPPASPMAKNVEERQDAGPFAPVRPKGFSTPGSSDAASAEAGFTQIFKPVARPVAGPSQAGDPIVSPLRPEALRNVASHGEVPPARAGEPPNAPRRDPSITSLIESLSSPAAPAGSQRAAEPAPYRPDPLAPPPPVAQPPQSSQFDSGGVTSFIQRLSDPAPSPKAPVSPTPVHVPNAGPGEYTQIISTSSKTASVPPPAAPTPAPASEAAFARPAAPPLPPVSVQVTPPQVHVAAPQVQITPPAVHAAAPTVAPPKIPAPQLPAAPALPAAAPPKGKLESLVPMLLVVNTFLLIAILVVMIFLIKAK